MSSIISSWLRLTVLTSRLFRVICRSGHGAVFCSRPCTRARPRCSPGSYLRTCKHVATYGDRLIADCRRTDGSWGRTDHARLGERTDGLVVPRVWPRPKCRKDSPAAALRLPRRASPPHWPFHLARPTGFAVDPPLEAGFELSVPPAGARLFRR